MPPGRLSLGCVGEEGESDDQGGLSLFVETNVNMCGPLPVTVANEGLGWDPRS